MRDDLIFHLTTTGEWKTHQNAGLYEPKTIEEQGFIHCCYGNQVGSIANRYFKGERDLLLIVIDLASLEAPVKKEEAGDNGEKFPHVYGAINIDAVIDKIKLEPDEDGTFEITFSSSE